jgi:hypothetical protein
MESRCRWSGTEGVTGVARWYLLASVVSFVPHTLIAGRILKLRYSLFLKALLPPFVCVTVLVPAAQFCVLATSSLGDLSSTCTHCGGLGFGLWCRLPDLFPTAGDIVVEGVCWIEDNSVPHISA